MSHTQYTKIQSENKTLGIIQGAELRKSVFGSKHFLRKPPAIAIDKRALDQAERAGAIRVVVIDQETGIRYLAAIAHIRRSGFLIDRGAGEQIALPLTSWIRQRQGAAVQLGLFE